MAQFLLVAEGGFTSGGDFVGTIHRKDLAANTWSVVHQVNDWIVEGGFIVARNAPNTVVTVTNDSHGEDISYSTDAGATWTDVGTSLFFAGGAIPVGYLAIADDGATLYGVNITGSQGIYKSTDWGASWTKIADEPGAQSLGGSLINRSIWQREGMLYWITNDSTPRIRLGRCAVDGSGLTTFTDAALDGFGAVQNVQMTGCMADDLLIAWIDQRSIGHLSVTQPPPVRITSPSGTPVFTTSAALESALDEWRIISITPVFNSLFVAQVENYDDAAMRVYTSTDGVSGWANQQTDPDAGHEADNWTHQFPVAGDATTLYAPLVIPNLWTGTSGGTAWAAETVPDITVVSDRGFVGVARCGVPALPGLSLFRASDGAQQYFQAFSS